MDPDHVFGAIHNAAAIPASHWQASRTTNQRSVVRKFSSRSRAKSSAARSWTASDGARERVSVLMTSALGLGGGSALEPASEHRRRGGIFGILRSRRQLESQRGAAGVVPLVSARARDAAGEAQAIAAVVQQ